MRHFSSNGSSGESNGGTAWRLSKSWSASASPSTGELGRGGSARGESERERAAGEARIEKKSSDDWKSGMSDDVAVVAWGEFGRTPTINKDAGRDHWPNVGCAVVAGGGFKTGQVIGATDRLGGEATERPVHFGEVFATLYHWLGIDLMNTTLPDLSGRPQYLVDGWQPMKELI